MADNNIVVIDGVWQKLTDAQFEAHYGYAVTTPRAGEKTYGGRYEHASWDSGSINSAGLVSPSDINIQNSGDTLFSISGSV
jgi:hypothetical protein